MKGPARTRSSKRPTLDMQIQFEGDSDVLTPQARERTEAKVAKPSTTRRDARLLRAGTPRRRASGSAMD